MNHLSHGRGVVSGSGNSPEKKIIWKILFNENHKISAVIFIEYRKTNFLNSKRFPLPLAWKNCFDLIKLNLTFSLFGYFEVFKYQKIFPSI
jgi:hypothetical protein